jgi:hypothetical protein
MRARRIWTLAKPEDHSASLDQLQLDLAAFNRCIGALEEANASPEDVEVLAAPSCHANPLSFLVKGEEGLPFDPEAAPADPCLSQPRVGQLRARRLSRVAASITSAEHGTQAE